MMEAEVLRIFEQTGAIRDGHFALSSGLHSGRYFQAALVLQHPQHTERLCKELALRLADLKPQVVAGPAFGGIVVAYETARHLEARSVFAEREGGKLALRRGFAVEPGERVIVTDDVITKGGSVLELAQLLRAHGAQVVGAGVLVDRSGGVDFDMRLEALAHVTVKNYPPEACPLCEQGLPLVKPGSKSRSA